MSGTRLFSTIAWYAVLAAIIYFVNIGFLNIICLLFAAFLVTGSILDRSDKKMLILKIILTVLLLVVYFYR